MFFKRFDKFFLINLHAVLARKFFGQFDRKAEGIVEAERNAAGNNFCGIFHQIRQKLFEFGFAFFERFKEFFLFAQKFVQYELPFFFKFGVRAFKVVDNDLGGNA